MTETNNASFRPSVWSIAFPSIVVFLINTVAGVAIIKIVSDLGPAAVAAITAGQRINFFSVALIMGMGAATTALVARAWGTQDKARAIAVTRLSMKLGLGVCILLAIAAISLAKPLANFFQLDDQSYTLAVDYIRLLSLFGPAQAVVLILSTSCRAVGDAKTPLFIGIFSNVIGVLGAYGFAYGQWGLPDLGVNGAAIGWGLSFCFSAGCYLVMWVKGYLLLPFTTELPLPKINLYRYMNISLPTIVEQLIIQSAMMLDVGVIGVYGTQAFATFGVGLNLFMVTMVIGMGFSIASSALAGQALGAGDIQGALDSTKHALKLSSGAMTITGVFSAIFADDIAFLMVNDAETAEIVAQFIFTLAILQPLLAIDFVLGGAMRGSGHTGFPLLAGLITVLGVRLPLASLVTELQLPIIWVFSVFIVDQSVKAALIAFRYRQKLWLVSK